MSAAPSVSHPLCARLYAKQANGAEAKGLAEQRRAMLEGVAGSVVEIGAGNGLNFGHYPPAVTVVHAFEPDPYLRPLAIEAAAEARVSISVGDAAAEDLPLADASVDAAVASLVLCSVSDIDQAIGELHRVLRPGGELRFNEHVVSDQRAWRALQRAADATLWPIVSGGCHLGRDTRAALEQRGFEIVRVKRFGFRVSALDPPKSHLLGIARRV
jgi:ubiquinone/menaquinone biosynthesis C-methylase UbiE